MTLPENIAFVDIETTGLNNRYDRVIEVGVVRMEKGKIIRTFSTLVDPGTRLPPEITSFTGITQNDLAGAPVFRQIASDLEDILSGCIFTAHNVRFDYGFLKKEFRRLGRDLKLKQLCTVRLSRELFPGESSHNLDAIIGRFNLDITNRHRALGDADAIRQFYQLLNHRFDPQLLAGAIAGQLRHPSLPRGLNRLKLDALPEKAGVYIFYGGSGMPLYIGKSVNIKNRVLSHFTAGLDNSGELRMSQEIKEIDYIVCEGELGALLKEAALIHEMQPLYNRRLRRTDKLVVVNTVDTGKGYRTVSLEKSNLPGPDTIGIFKTKKQAVDFLRQKGGEGHLCEILLGLEKVRPRCFDSDLGKCLACTGREDPVNYNLRFDLVFAGAGFLPWPFTGPVVISEAKGRYVFDNWCYLGQFKNETWLADRKSFDLDTYKILKSYMLRPANRRHISLLATQFAYLIK